MTALAAAPTADRRRARLTPRGLVWSVLRLHRMALYVWGAALVALAATMIWMYVIGDDARAAGGPCGSAGSGLPSCLDVTELTADDIYRHVLALTARALSFLMFPVAAWAGGALVGRELESGTARLAWTQSVTPLRWLAAKLAVPALLLTAGTTTAVLLNVWARQDDDVALVGDWYHADVFVSTGPAAVTYALAGLALGALAGLATRRSLPAAGLGFAATLGLYTVLLRFRWELWPAKSVTVSPPGTYHLPGSANYLSSGFVLTSGERRGGMLCADAPPGLACLKEADITGSYITFHPESHRWPLLLVDAGIALAVTALATAAAFWLLRRRTP